MAETIGARIGAYKPSKTVWFWSVVGAAALKMIVGFKGGGWVTRGAAVDRAQGAAEDAVADLAASICEHRFLLAPDAGVQLSALKEKSSYQRHTFVEEGGWVTFAGAEKPVAGAGELCADRLMEAEVPVAAAPPVAEATADVAKPS
jgi:hypothetical protein